MLMLKSTGIVRRIDDLGRFVIPKELRDTIGIEIGTSLEVFVDGDTIILRKYEPGCTFCGSLDGTWRFKGKLVCGHCADDIAAKAAAS